MPSIERKHIKPGLPRLSFGFIIFSTIFVYMVIRIAISANETELSIFQVEESSYNVNFTETGIAIRSETVYYCSKSGYACYYVRDGEKVAKGANVYSIDETGSMEDALYNVKSEEVEVLSEDDYTYIEKQIQVFKASFDASSFSEVYDFKNTLEAKVLELYEDLALEQLQADSSFDSTFSAFTSTASGVVTYYTDGYESITAEDLTADDFDKTSYDKTSLKKSTSISAGEAVYKMVSDESWQIAVMLSKDEYLRIKDLNTVKFKINDSTKKITASFEIIEKDDNYFIILSLSKYMAEYISDRYLNITFIFSETNGLKIPNSAITQKEVIMVPISFLTEGSGTANGEYLNEVVVDADGGTSLHQISPTIYFTDEHFCYVDPDSFDEGTVLSTEGTSPVTMAVSDFGTYMLDGAFYVTQGVAVFKQIEVLVDGDDYTIIASNTTSGIREYDRIALHAEEVYEGQIIY